MAERLQFDSGGRRSVRCNSGSGGRRWILPRHLWSGPKYPQLRWVRAAVSLSRRRLVERFRDVVGGRSQFRNGPGFCLLPGSLSWGLTLHSERLALRVIARANAQPDDVVDVPGSFVSLPCLRRTSPTWFVVCPWPGLASTLSGLQCVITWSELGWWTRGVRCLA
ncbi:hypothetical protein R1flu_002417 [Riccia fluitans]|uniref:Uncharacterized protein n=1 Tax=Riccia fluitans TaxID=41844 RepID=A0ABD1Y624_9MARC